MTAPKQSRPTRAAAPGSRADTERCSCGLAQEGQLGQAYNEAAFQYFLSIEQKRSMRSGRPFLLLLVELKKRTGATVDIDSATASKLFSRLWVALRETDFIGWYSEDRVAGAVLTQRADVAHTNATTQVRQRVSRMLTEGLPPDVARQLHVRVINVRPASLSGASCASD